MSLLFVWSAARLGASAEMTCHDVKNAYKGAGCCGQPHKPFDAAGLGVAGTCPGGDGVAEGAADVPSGIFDPPDADEMRAVAARMASFDFSAEGPGIVLNEAPLQGPDRAAIDALFEGASVATTVLDTPAGLGPIWGGIMTTYIARIDTLPVPKAAALAYLGEGGPRPERYAKVNVAFGQLDPPKFSEYKVGPLGAEPGSMVVEKIADQLWGSRPREGNEMRALKTMVDMILTEPDMQTITRESFAGKTHGVGLNNHEPAPPGTAGAQRTTQILINFAVEGTWRGKDLNIMPMSFTINNTARDPSRWTAGHFYYNLQGPFTRDELVAKYADGSLAKVVIPESHFEDIQKSSFPQRRPELPFRAHATLPGPAAYMPAGARYTVAGRTVRWMDWEFHAGYTFRAGPDFHNIAFKGERVAYQVALNEVGLIYSANDPVAGNVFFLDSTFGNGEYRELMRGVDCPDYATYLTNYWWAAPGGAVVALRSTCVYETFTGAPIWRRGGSFVSGLKNEELHVRFAMPNGNYDYIMTYIFRLDGSMRVESSSSGYIQTHFWPESRAPMDSMAYRVHTFTGASLHDHTYGWKVDLDVGATANSFKTIEYKMADTLAAINEQRAERGEQVLAEKPPYLLYNKMRYVTETTVADEDSARMNVDPAHPKSWIFGDSTNLNRWGNMRAYKLSLDQSPQAVVDDDHYTMPAFSYAKQMLAVTKYHEEEATLTGAYDLNRLDDPQGGLHRMVNGEPIVQEDLVAWVTLVSFHLPTSENIPMVNLMEHGFTLTPWNFFDENPTMDMPHYLRMHPGEAPGDTRAEDPPSPEKPCVPQGKDTSHEFSGV